MDVAALQADVPQEVIENFETADIIRIAGLGGNDVIDASAPGAGASLLIEGGAGDDIVLGSGDLMIEMENLAGSSFADALAGNGPRLTLVPRDGLATSGSA